MGASPKSLALRPGSAEGREDGAESRAARITFRHATPPPRAAVERPDLFDRLDRAPPGGLMLVTGPPGAGKTVLLRTWLAARPPAGPVAWLSLEPLDGRPARFWSELLKVVCEAVGEGHGALPDPLDPVDGQLFAALSAALDELPVPLLVILDDFEQLHSRQVTDTLDRFLRRCPLGLRLVIASRLDPGLSLQRLRLEGRLSELRSNDLALTRAQAGELFEMAGLELADEQVDKLHARTEGWAGGLSLAALSLPSHPDPEGFVDSFAGDERTIADYLVEEVLNQQPSEMREFMLRTSVVARLEPDLADALTGGSHGARMLELLARSNGFLLPVDERHRSYRYHPMFLELLRSQLRYRMPEAYTLEHRRAARWFAGHGMAKAAVGHASRAGDLATTTDLLCEHWLSLIAGGETEELVGWIDALPRHLVAGRADLAVAGAGAALELGDLEHADGYIALADSKAAHVPGKRRAHFTISRTVVTMLKARLRGDFEATQSAARKVLAGHQLVGLPGETRALALLNLGVAECWMESARPGLEHLEQALELAGRDGSQYLALGCLGQLAMFKALTGDLRDAAVLGQSAVRTAVEHGWDELTTAAPAYLALAMTHYYWAELEQAEDDLGRATRAIRRSQDRTTLCLIELFRAQLLAPTDVHEAARVTQAVASDIADWRLPPALAAGAALAEARLLAESGEAERARENLAEHTGGDAPLEYGLVGARLALSEGEPTEALRWLATDPTADPVALHPSSHIEALALGAVSNHLAHDDQRALALLELALTKAQAQGFRQPLLDVGSPLRDLLKRRIRAGTAHRTLAGELIAILEEREGVSHGDHRLILDPLSDREEAVLRYLPTLMSKAEIASELFVSVNTVKTHTKNIYRKLGVGTRTEAVRRAKSLNLV